MNKIRAIIIDDERKAQEVLTMLLERNCPNVEILAQCGDVISGTRAIKQHQPDLVFLDIQMPEYAGFEIVNFIETINFEIIFVTAFNHFAIKAFELSAIDYLTKPVNRERLKEAVEKATLKKEQKDNLIAYKTLLDNLKGESTPQIVIKDISGRHVIKLQDIVSIEGQRAYSEIILNSGKRMTVSKNLKSMQELFSDYKPLFRCHKSWIVNIDYLDKIKSSELTIYLTDGRSVRLSSTKLKELLDLIKTV